jgi:outer membrane protein assembly factor BamB
MKPIINKWAVLFLTIIVALVLASLILYSFRRNPTIKVALTTVLGDRALKATLDGYKVKFIPKESVHFETSDGEDVIEPTWAFRPSHAVPTYPIPVTGDIDQDGKPEVYIGSYSKELYALDGKTGNTLWEWQLPFGVIGGRVVELGDLDGDGTEEIIIGSNTSLPIRVYALKGVVRNNEDRLLWATNVSGDFLEGGLSFIKETSYGSPLIIAATRDAPYSHGTLNVINPDGSFLFSPAEGLDVCASRPAIGNLPGSTELALIHGSHRFVGAAYGHRIVARNLRTGEIRWISPEIGDTGSQNHQIVDVDFDGRNEVFAFGYDQNTHENHYYILDGVNGAIIREVPWHIQGVIRESKRLFVAQNNETLCLGADGGILYSIPQISFAIESEENSELLLLNISYQDNKLIVKCYSASDGALIKEYSSNLEVPRHNNLEDYGGFGEPSSDAIFCTLADTDNDGRWDALIQIRDFIINVKLPFKVLKGNNPLSPIPFRNTDNSGFSKN